MKILLLNQTFYPDTAATSQQVADLAKYLKSQGHQVSVVTSQRAYDRPSVLFAKDETWDGIRIYRVYATGMGKGRVRYRLLDSLSFDLSLLWRLLWIPRQDVVVGFTSPPLIGIFATFFSLLKSARCIQWLMDVNPDSAFAVGYLKRKSLVGRVLNALFEFTLRQADDIIVLDRWMKNRMLAHGAKPEQISIVPPWPVLDTSSEGLATRVAAFRKEHGLEGKFVVLYSGNHSVVHPLTTVLDAAYRLRKDPSVLFLFIGHGVRTKEVAEFKEKYSLENIKQLPLQPREVVKASFGSANLHLVVLGEPMSGLVHLSKIYSVLASGIPFVFVGPKQSHVCDLLAEISVGASVETNAPDQLVSAILTAQKRTPEEYAQVREQAHGFVHSRANSKKILEEFHHRVLLGREDNHESVAATSPTSS